MDLKQYSNAKSATLGDVEYSLNQSTVINVKTPKNYVEDLMTLTSFLHYGLNMNFIDKMTIIQYTQRLLRQIITLRIHYPQLEHNYCSPLEVLATMASERDVHNLATY